MIVWWLAATAFAGIEFGASLGVVLAEDTVGDGMEDAPAGTIYTGAGVLELIRGEAHLGYTGLGGVGGVESVEVSSRSGDLRLLGGVAIPLLTLPNLRVGADALLGPDIRMTHVRTEIFGLETSSLAFSMHPSIAVGPYAEVWRARLGLRAWGDLPREGRFGVSAMGGVRF